MPQRTLFDKKSLNELKKHPLYSQDGKGGDAVASVKIFNPYGRGTWYITEWDGDDTMYGYYKGSDSDEGEYGYMSKSEFENTRVRVFGQNMPLERDAYFKPTKLSKIAPRAFSQQTNGSQFSNDRSGGAETSAKGGSNG